MSLKCVQPGSRMMRSGHVVEMIGIVNAGCWGMPHLQPLPRRRLSRRSSAFLWERRLECHEHPNRQMSSVPVVLYKEPTDAVDFKTVSGDWKYLP